jgi:hypothetical protein
MQEKNIISLFTIDTSLSGNTEEKLHALTIMLDTLAYLQSSQKKYVDLYGEMEQGSPWDTFMSEKSPPKVPLILPRTLRKSLHKLQTIDSKVDTPSLHACLNSLQSAVVALIESQNYSQHELELLQSLHTGMSLHLSDEVLKPTH